MRDSTEFLDVPSHTVKDWTRIWTRICEVIKLGNDTS